MENYLVHMFKGTANTVGELIEQLSTLDKNYTISFCGMSEYALLVDDMNNCILIDDPNSIVEIATTANEQRCKF